MIKFSDRTNILLDDVKTTTDGYKIVRSRVAKTGVQTYLGKDFDGQAKKYGFSDSAKVIVYRSPEEVFASDSVNGWAGVPVTKDHPSDKITPDNVKEYQVGDVRDKAHVDLVGGWIGLEYIIRDSDAIRSFESGGYKEVSGGYLADIDWIPGVTPDGKKYDAKQIGIVPNHLALVPRGRAFSDSAENWGAMPINLNDQKEPKLDMIKIMVGDKAVQVAANDADTITSLVKDHKTAIDAKDVTIGELKAKLADAESKVLDEAAVAKLVDAKVKAQAMLEAVKAKFGDEAIKDASGAEIAGMFRVIGTAVNDSVRDAIKEKKTNSADPWGDVIAKMPGYEKKGDK